VLNYTHCQTVVVANLGPRYKNILDSISGIVFLGSPLRGSRLQPVGSVIATAAGVVGYGDSHLFKDLDAQERSLIDLLKEFTEILTSHSISAYCFFEQHKTVQKKYGVTYAV
jgi:hypothetical protein